MVRTSLGNIVITYDDWHACGGYEWGGFWTTRLFWDCECKEDYIHPKSLIACPSCRVFEDDGYPDSRVTEVLEAGLAVVDTVRKGFELASGFTLTNGEFEITGYGTMGEFLDYKEYKFLITDGLGQLGEVTISLGLSGSVLVSADQIILDEDGQEQSRKGVSKFLFESARKVKS